MGARAWWYLRLALAASACAGGSRTLAAQARRGRAIPADLTSDSVAWQRVLAHVAAELSAQLVRAAADPAPQPWTLQLPPDEPQRPVLEAQLRTLLRARPVTPDDSVVHALAVGPLLVDGDTARVRVRVSETRRCPGSPRTTGSSWTETVLVARHPSRGFWGAALSRGGVVGDDVGCPAPVR